MMKRATKHRKRHALPGPAGLLQQRQHHHQQQHTRLSDDRGQRHYSNQHEKEDNKDNGDDEDNDEEEEEEKKEQDPFGYGLNHRHQSLSRNETISSTKMHEYIQIWDAMCVALNRILPVESFSGGIAAATTSRSFFYDDPYSNLLLRKALGGDYTLLSDIPYLSTLKIPKIVLQVHNVFTHGHCNYTVEVLDESTSRPEIGWLSQDLIRNHPEWIRAGTVFLCCNVSLAVFQTERNTANTSVVDLDGRGNRNHHHHRHQQQQLQQQQQHPRRQRVVEAFDRMLVLGEENIVYAWTKQNIGDVGHKEYLDLLERRSEVEQELLAMVGDDVDLDHQQMEEDQDMEELNEEEKEEEEEFQWKENDTLKHHGMDDGTKLLSSNHLHDHHHIANTNVPRVSVTACLDYANKTPELQGNMNQGQVPFSMSNQDEANFVLSNNLTVASKGCMVAEQTSESLPHESSVEKSNNAQLWQATSASKADLEDVAAAAEEVAQGTRMPIESSQHYLQDCNLQKNGQRLMTMSHDLDHAQLVEASMDMAHPKASHETGKGVLSNPYAIHRLQVNQDKNDSQIHTTAETELATNVELPSNSSAISSAPKYSTISNPYSRHQNKVFQQQQNAYGSNEISIASKSTPNHDTIFGLDHVQMSSSLPDSAVNTDDLKNELMVNPPIPSKERSNQDQQLIWMNIQQNSVDLNAFEDYNDDYAKHDMSPTFRSYVETKLAGAYDNKGERNQAVSPWNHGAHSEQQHPDCRNFNFDNIQENELDAFDECED